MPALRIVFFGTAELACPSLTGLAQASEFEVAGVVTQPDRPRGRDLRVQPPPVKREALSLGMKILQPERARHASFIEELAQVEPELIVVAAYGQILPQAILELPRYGCLNVHTSLLPKYRGAAPIQWAILNDEAETGVTIMKMDAGLDTGDILTQQSVRIETSDTAQSLHDKLAAIGADLLVRTIPPYCAGAIVPKKQPDENASYARKIAKEDGKLDWTQPARAVWNRIRAFTPWPGAYTFLPLTSRQPTIRILEAVISEHGAGPPGTILKADKSGIDVACGAGALRILRLQREGGKPLKTQEFLAGHALRPGERLGLSGSEQRREHA